MPFVFDSSCSSTTTALFRPVVNIADVRIGAEPPPAAAVAAAAAAAVAAAAGGGSEAGGPVGSAAKKVSVFFSSCSLMATALLPAVMNKPDARTGADPEAEAAGFSIVRAKPAPPPSPPPLVLLL